MRVSGGKTPGKFESLESLEEKSSCLGLSVTMLVMGAGQGTCGEGGGIFIGTSIPPAQGAGAGIPSH